MITEQRTFNAECDRCEKIYSEESDYSSLRKLCDDMHRDGWRTIGDKDPTPTYCKSCSAKLNNPNPKSE